MKIYDLFIFIWAKLDLKIMQMQNKSIKNKVCLARIL